MKVKLTFTESVLGTLSGNKELAKEVIVTNSIPQTEEFKGLPFIRIKCLSDTLARTINRIHYSRSVSEAFYRPQS